MTAQRRLWPPSTDPQMAGLSADLTMTAFKMNVRFFPRDRIPDEIGKGLCDGR